MDGSATAADQGLMCRRSAREAGRGGARRGVQVVGRLVQHEQVGRRQERRRQADAPALRANPEPSHARPRVTASAVRRRSAWPSPQGDRPTQEVAMPSLSKVRSRCWRPAPASRAGAPARQRRSRHEAASGVSGARDPGGASPSAARLAARQLRHRPLRHGGPEPELGQRGERGLARLPAAQRLDGGARARERVQVAGAGAGAGAGGQRAAGALVRGQRGRRRRARQHGADRGLIRLRVQLLRRLAWISTGRPAQPLGRARAAPWDCARPSQEVNLALQN